MSRRPILVGRKMEAAALAFLRASLPSWLVKTFGADAVKDVRPADFRVRVLEAHEVRGLGTILMPMEVDRVEITGNNMIVEVKRAE